MHVFLGSPRVSSLHPKQDWIHSAVFAQRSHTELCDTDWWTYRMTNAQDHQLQQSFTRCNLVIILLLLLVCALRATADQPSNSFICQQSVVVISRHLTWIRYFSWMKISKILWSMVILARNRPHFVQFLKPYELSCTLLSRMLLLDQCYLLMMVLTSIPPSRNQHGKCLHIVITKWTCKLSTSDYKNNSPQN